MLSSQTAARRALDLDSINRAANHTDKFLDESQRSRLQELLNLPGDGTNLIDPN
jgi:hypothetical protein